MALSDLVPGKRNSIAQGGESVQQAVPERAAHAPMFARPGEPEPNAISGERLQPGPPVPKAMPSRTRAEASGKGLGGPEALDLTRDEVDSWR